MNEATTPTQNRIIRLPETLEMVGLGSRSALNRAIVDAGFPKPVKLTKRAVGWRLSDVQSWIENRPAAR